MGTGGQSDEGAKERWRRRAVTVPAALVLTGVATAVYVPALAVALVADVVRRDRGAMARALTFLVVFLWCETGGIVVAAWLWLAYRRDGERFLAANARLQTVWSGALFAAGRWLFRIGLVIDGDVGDVPGGDGADDAESDSWASRRVPLLVMVRHASTLDTVIPVVLLARRFGYRLRYVMKRELLTDPCLDIVGNRLPNRFVRRDGARTDAEVERLVSLYDGMGAGDALVVFPEGTRFSAAKRARAIERLAARGPSRELVVAESLAHTLSPLRRGPLALLARNPGADLVVIAHTGLEPAGSLATLARGDLVGATLRVRVRRVPFARIPADEAGQAELLARLWRDADDLVVEASRPHVEANVAAPRPARGRAG